MQSIRWAISGFAFTLSASIGAAPSVTLDAPATGVRYVSPAAIEIVANPTVDAGRTIERVEFLADGEIITTVGAAPYSFTWTNVPKGNYNLRARVYDSAGRRDTSPTVRVHVRDNTAPKVRLSAPEHRYIAPGSVPLSATVTDRDDPIAKVEFFSGDTLLFTSTAEPYTFDWTAVPAGNYDVTAKATDALGAVGTSNPFHVRVRDNVAPRVRILGPENNTTYTAPATIPISLRAIDRDDNLTNVVLSANGTQLIAFNTAPYEFSWTNIPAGTYALTAQATDELGLITTSRTVTVTVTGIQPPAEKKAYFIHVDHLNTPRMIADEMQRVVWKWDQAEPFGDNAPDENPGGLGAFEFPQRFPGQYFDKETNLHYNYFRDFDPTLGQYIESDPIGLEGGVNTYGYVLGDPLRLVDINGLEVRVYCRYVTGIEFTMRKHCFVYVSCPQEGWERILSLFGASPLPISGRKSMAEPGLSGLLDDPRSKANVNNIPIVPKQNPTCDPCGYEKDVLQRFQDFPGGTVFYSIFGPNSNTFTNHLVTSPMFGAGIPAGSITNAPGLTYPSSGWVK